MSVSDERGRTLGGSLARWLSDVAPATARGAVSVAVISDARVRALNREYRKKDCATDVLSFPAEDALSESAATRRGPADAGHYAKPRHLGDIVIARGVAQRQAKAAGHAERTELRVLALHGLLHLLGYDHDTDDGAMARIEKRLRRKGRLREGLIERQ
ncbi:MAG: rRNA maturation RNase YbeY [Vicinamibacterales bacterium]